MDALLRHRELALHGIRLLPVVEFRDDFADLDDELDEETTGLLLALQAFDDDQPRFDVFEWDERDAAFESKHPRGPGGEFSTIASRIMHALDEWAKGNGSEDPLHEFQGPKGREQLRQAAKKRGIELKRGASIEEIKQSILDSHRQNVLASKAEKPPTAAGATAGHQRFSITHNGQRLDVGIFGSPTTGKLAIYRENDHGVKSGRAIKSFDDIGGVAQWARQQGHSDLADYAEAEAKRTGVNVPAVPAKRAPRKAGAKAELAPAFAHDLFTPEAAAKFGKGLDPSLPASRTQAHTDAQKAVSDTLAEIHQLRQDGASDKVMEARIRARAKLAGLNPKTTDELVQAASGDRSGLDSTLARIAQTAGVNAPGELPATPHLEPGSHADKAAAVALLKQYSAGDIRKAGRDLGVTYPVGMKDRDAVAEHTVAALTQWSDEGITADFRDTLNGLGLSKAQAAPNAPGNRDAEVEQAIRDAGEAANGIPAGAPKAMRASVGAELGRQAEIVPQVFGSGYLSRVTVASPPQWDDLRRRGAIPNGESDHVSAAYVRPGNGILFSPDWVSNRAQVEQSVRHQLAEDHLAWSYPHYDVKKADPAEAVMRHEFGHVVASKWPKAAGRTQDGSVVEEHWTPAQRRELIAPLAEELRVEPPAAGEDIATWWHRSDVQRAAQSKISGYARTSIQEALAEIWAVHSGRGEDATPLAKRIGGIMQNAWSGSAGLPSAHSDAEVEQAIRNAHAAIMANPNRRQHGLDTFGPTVGEIRQELGDKYSKAEVDAALSRLSRQPDVNLLPEENQKALTAQDRLDAVNVGGRDYHALQIQGAPKPAAPRKRAPRTTKREFDLLMAGVELRLAGHDTHPGDPERLKEYWLTGKGAGLWIGSPRPWTTLYGHLLKYMPPGEAKRTAAQWFHEHFGFWPGADLNRVTHGMPPRGHRVGPG